MPIFFMWGEAKETKKFAKNIPWLTSKTNHVIPVRNISLVKKISASNRQEERWVHTFTAVNLIVTCRMTEVKFENSENRILKYVQLKHLQPIPTCCAREKIDLDGHETVTFKIVTRSAWQTWFVATVWMIIAVSISAAGQQSQCCKRSGLDERHHSVNFLLVIVDDGKKVSWVVEKSVNWCLLRDFLRSILHSLGSRVKLKKDSDLYATKIL